MYEIVKFLYGLKQAPKQWHGKFDKVMLSNLYLINGASKCIKSFTLINVSLFVFDILMTCLFYELTMMLCMKLNYFLHLILICKT
jgi:hypothetical protein